MGKSRKKIESLWLELRAFSLYISFLISGSLLSQPQTHQVFPPPSGCGTTIIDTITFPGILPGDVVCLMAGTFHQLLIRNIHGLPGKPVTFRNEGGQVVISNETHYGISVRNCSFVDFTGNGKPDIQYGIFIQKVKYGAGITFEKLSTDVSVSFVEITNTKLAAIIAKSDPNCSFESLRENFTMCNVMIHDNYIHDVQSEALYIGHSFYNGFNLNCDGADTLVLPHVNIGVHVFNNTIQRTGRNAMQIASAYSNCKIHDNMISHDSQSEVYNQMGGIIIGGGSVCDCYNNHIAHGKGSGIEVFGRGNFMIFNNVIEFPGRSYKPDTAQYFYPKHGIFIKDVNTDPGATIGIFHNTIINPKSDGILFTNTSLAGSRVQNNIITGPGSIGQIGYKAFIHSENVDLLASNNWLLTSVEDGCFSDHFNSDFSLRSTSLAIDKGIEISDCGIDFDKNYNPRPLGTGYDIGAFEFDPELSVENQFNSTVYPNPFNDSFILAFCMPGKGNVTVNIFSLDGQMVFSKDYFNLSEGSQKVVITPKMNGFGVYILRLVTSDFSHNRRILKL